MCVCVCEQTQLLGTSKAYVIVSASYLFPNYSHNLLTHCHTAINRFYMRLDYNSNQHSPPPAFAIFTQVSQP